MNPGQNPRPVSEVSDFAEVLLSRDGTELPILVGGHAVNLWGLYFLKSGVGGLANHLPFTSKDLDLIATMEFLHRLHRRFKGTLLRSPPRSPVLGRLEIRGEREETLKIEVLHTVKGLNPRELAQTVELRVDDVFARVLLPHFLLKAKIQNSIDIDQEARNDVKHVKMMILCVLAFIKNLLANIEREQYSERMVVNILGEEPSRNKAKALI